MEPAGVTFPVWGTTARLLVTEPARLAEAREILDAELTAIGDACDRFRPDSELSRINARPGTASVVTPLLAEVLAHALRVAEATRGSVDPTVGAAVIAAGYDRDLELVRRDGPGPCVAVRTVHGWRSVRLTGRTLRTPPGVLLDLGATAKALAADRAATRAAAATGCGVLVALGGDIAVAGEPPRGGWRIRVTDDHRAGHGQDVAITSGGLATSSVTVRRWRRDGRWLHHIVDPATGLPVRPHWRTASVAAASCVDANAAATAALVEGRAFRHRLPARLVATDGTVLTLAGWPAAEAAA